MNKSPKEMGLNPCVKAHRRSPGVFMKILKNLEVKQSIIKGGKEVGQLCTDVEYS